MVTYELLSLHVPFSNYSADVFVMLAIMRGELPKKPDEIGAWDAGVFKKLWNLCGLCWSNDSSSRPLTLQITSLLVAAEENALREEAKEGLEGIGLPARFPERIVLTHSLDTILSNLSHLNLDGQIIHEDYTISRIGSSCDVYTAWSVRHNKKVAVKQIRVSLGKDMSLAKRLAKEIRIWCLSKTMCLLSLATSWKANGCCRTW